MDAVFEAVQHRRPAAEYRVFHYLLPEVFVAALETGLDHLGERLVAVHLLEENLARGKDALLREFNDRPIGQLIALLLKGAVVVLELALVIECHFDVAFLDLPNDRKVVHLVLRVHSNAAV